MSAHHTSYEAPARPLHPNPTFGVWVSQTPYVWVTQLLTGLTLFAGAIYYTIHVIHEGHSFTAALLITVNAALHIPLLIAAGLYLAYDLDNNEQGRTRTGFLWDQLFTNGPSWSQIDRRRAPSDPVPLAFQAVRSFKMYFLFFILCMLLYYAWVLLYGSHHDPATGDPMLVWTWREMAHVAAGDYVGYVFNTMGGVALLCCFLQILEPTRSLWPVARSKKGLVVVLGGALCCLLPLLLVKHYLQGYHYDVEALKHYMVILNWLSGVFNAIVMMVMISRLDSKLIGLQSSLVGILYTYAAVQTLFAVFPPASMEQVKALTLYAVLFLKVYFFFIVHFALSQGRIFCYMACSPMVAKAHNEHSDTEALRSDRRFKSQIQSLRHKQTWLAHITSLRKRAMHLGVRFSTVGGLILLVIVSVVPFLFKDPALVSRIKEDVSIAHFFMLSAIYMVFRFTPRWIRNETLGTQIYRAHKRWQAVHPAAERWPTSVEDPEADPHAVRSDEVGPALGRLDRLFQTFLGCLVVYYAFRWSLSSSWIAHLFPMQTVVGTARSGMLEVLLNNGSGLTLFLSFLELAHPRTCVRYAKRRARYQRYAWMTFAGICLLQLVVAASWTDAGAAQIASLPKQMMLWRTFSGTIVSIVIALFIARFDSGMMWQDRFAVRCLMLYAAIQPMLVIFGETEYTTIMVSTLAQALVLKLWLAVVVWRAIYRGGMVSYLLSFPEIDHMANRVFRHGLLVRMAEHGHREQRIEVYNAGKLVLTADHHDGTVVGFMEVVERLKRCGQHRSNYDKRAVNGAWRVSLSCSSGPHLIGRTDFISEHKADAFILKTSDSIKFIRPTYAP